MDAQAPLRSDHQRWTLDDIPWHAIDRQLTHDDEILMYLVTSASFVEITSDYFTRNLIDYFEGDLEIQHWLREHWEPEELQHGRALRRYVEHVWPEFDWEVGYRAFIADYSNYCQLQFLGPTRSRELVARCVVEMGTATYYTTLAEVSREPVLARLALQIRADEIRHYKYFYHYFLRYRETEQPSRLKILATLWNRIREIVGEDGQIAIKHVYTTSHPGETFDRQAYRALLKRYRQTVSAYYPYRMAGKMLLKPLRLAPGVQHLLLPVLLVVARQVVG